MNNLALILIGVALMASIMNIKNAIQRIEVLESNTPETIQESIDEQAARMDEQFNQMLEACGTDHLYGADAQCRIDFLRRNDDVGYDDGNCWGGNSIGWYHWIGDCTEDYKIIK